MAVTNRSRLVGFDADAAVDAIRESVEGTLYACSEFTVDDFQVLYLAEETRSLYRDDEQRRSHFERLHSYVHLDFTEVELFTGSLFPTADRVRHVTTGLDTLTIVRIYRDDEGLFVAVDPDEPVQPIVAAAESRIED